MIVVHSVPIAGWLAVCIAFSAAVCSHAAEPAALSMCAATAPCVKAVSGFSGIADRLCCCRATCSCRSAAAGLHEQACWRRRWCCPHWWQQPWWHWARSCAGGAGAPSGRGGSAAGLSCRRRNPVVEHVNGLSMIDWLIG
jgi:hypothetical protein